MIDVNLNGTEPTHVERISPQITVDDSGNVIWMPGLLDYDATVFGRGKTVTNEEFNTLFLRQLYQSNYITDSLTEFLKTHLDTVIGRKFTKTYKLVKSFTKIITQSDWGEIGADGYAYIDIPVSEHGFKPLEDASATGKMNIDTELYLLNTDGNFYEVDQIITKPDNTVQLYTDDTTVTGIVVIRTNERSYALAAGTINAEDVIGLAKVGRTGLYTDLTNLPDLSGITKNTNAINAIINGNTIITNATNATNAINVTGKIANQNITDIFETGSSVVKNATNAIYATVANTAATATNADNATNAENAIKDLSNNTYTGLTLRSDGSLTLKNSYLKKLPIRQTHDTGIITIPATEKGYMFDTNTLQMGKSYEFVLENSQIVKFRMSTSVSIRVFLNIIHDEDVPQIKYFQVVYTDRDGVQGLYCNYISEDITTGSHTYTYYTGKIYNVYEITE